MVAIKRAANKEDIKARFGCSEVEEEKQELVVVEFFERRNYTVRCSAASVLLEGPPGTIKPCLPRLLLEQESFLQYLRF